MNESKQTIELEIKSQAQQAKTSVDSLIKSLTNIEKTITNIYLELGHVEKGLKNTTKDSKDTANNLDKMRDKADKTANSFSKLSKALSLGAIFQGTKKLTSTFLDWMGLAVDRTEQLNLFNVVFKNIEKDGIKLFSNLGREATKFQNKLNEAFGTNMTETTKFQGLFQSMAENVGINDYYSSIMSETMSKLTYDLASLYNKQETDVAEALRAGVYAGQTKPLRAYGVDVTQTSLQPILDQLGIDDRTISQMSQAEKEILRYIATLKQAKVAMGDFANTVESPANQLKVFKQQLVEVKIALSNLFIGAFSQILPYVNAFLMVIKEVAKAIANMLGIEMSDYNTGIATTTDLFDDMGESIDDATGKAKELKRQTLGFDQIHNINENNGSGSGFGAISGGIDQRLLDAIKGYDNGMDKVKMKATEIRDKIMEWLGFTKKINPLTGETYFKYEGIKKTLKNMWDSFKGLSTQGKILVGLGIGIGALKLLDTGKKLITIFGSTGLIKIMKDLFSPTKLLVSFIKDDLAGGFTGLASSIGKSIDMWSKTLSLADKLKMTLIGTGGLILSMQGMSNAMKSVSNEGWNLGNSLQAVASGLGGIASGALIGGSIFGAWGAVIGGAVGALLELHSAIDGYQTRVDKLIDNSKELRNSTEKYLETLNEKNKAIEEELVSNIALEKSHENLLNELKSITDENGKVKKGYETRAEFILSVLSNAYGIEYSLLDGVIDKYKDYISNIEKAIETKKAEILLKANEEKYAEALENEIELWSKKRDAQSKVNELLDEQQTLQEKVNKMEADLANDKTINAYSIIRSKRYKEAVKDLKNVQQELNNWQVVLDNATNKYVDCLDTQFKYSNLQEAVLTGNLEEIEEATKNFTNSYVSDNGIVTLTLEQRMAKELEAKDYITNLYKDASEEKRQVIQNSCDSTIQSTIDELIGVSNSVDNLSDEVINSWGLLSSKSEEKFLENFSKLLPNVQSKVVEKMYEKGYAISDELQRGINKINPTINVNANVGNAETKISQLLSRVTGSLMNPFTLRFNKNGGSFYNGSWHEIEQYAYGGVPKHGSMFIAGEAGAEIVGNINGRTEVLNQSQISSTIYSAMVSALSKFNGGNSTQFVDVRVHSDASVVVDEINQITKQTGEFPLDIPTDYAY